MVPQPSGNGSKFNTQDIRSEGAKKSPSKKSPSEVAIPKTFAEILKTLIELDPAIFPIPGVPNAVTNRFGSVDKSETGTNAAPKRDGKRGPKPRKERVNKPVQVQVPKEAESKVSIPKPVILRQASVNNASMAANAAPKRDGKRGRKPDKGRVYTFVQGTLEKEVGTKIESPVIDDWASLY